jgi:predicted transcriptional regulator
MPKGKKESADKLLTETELELMTILWRLGEGSVSEVQEALPEDRPLAYTSISTILRILEQKGVLKARKEGRGHVYVPVLSKADYEAKTVRHVVNRVFDGAPVSLVRQLLNTVDLAPQDLEELRRILDAAGRKK